jgi:sec-independent protein translocase protein TatC
VVDDAKMSLIDHLAELRRRIIISIAAILLVGVVAFFLSDPLLKILLLPSGGLQLKGFNLTDGFTIKTRIALYTGIVLAFPVWAYHLYRFVAPGLLEHERKAIFPAFGGSLILFVIGSVFGYYLLWGMIRVLIDLFPPQIDYLPSADDYISFVTFFLLACGAAFQLPSLLLILVRLRLLTSTILRKQRRVAYFALFVFAEIITPVSDPIVAPVTVMAPLVLLYELSVFLARRIEASRQKREEALAMGSAMTPPSFQHK